MTERKVLNALKLSSNLLSNGRMPLDYVRRAYNRQQHRSMAIEKSGNKTLGAMIRGLGLEVRKGTGNRTVVIWDQETFVFQCKKNGVREW